jgi:osmotically-inducible protein OsmY
MASQKSDQSTHGDRQSATSSQQSERRQDMSQNGQRQSNQAERSPQRDRDSYDEKGLAMSRMTGHKTEQVPSAEESLLVDDGTKADRGPDDCITDEFKDQLTRRGEIDSSDVVVKVHDGEVTLTGTVKSDEAKREVEDIAKGVSGVRQVTNQIRVRSKDQFPDNPEPTE